MKYSRYSISAASPRGGLLHITGVDGAASSWANWFSDVVVDGRGGWFTGNEQSLPYNADITQFTDAYAQTLTYAMLLARFEGELDLHFRAADRLEANFSQKSNRRHSS